MNTNETIWVSIITSLGFGGLLQFVMQWIFKDRREQRDKEAIVNLTHKLELAAAEKNLRFSHTFPYTAKTMEDICAKLEDFDDAIVKFQVTYNSRDEAVKSDAVENVSTKRKAFQDFFLRNRIYIPPSTEKKVLEYFTTLNSKHITFTTMKSSQGAHPETTQVLIRLNEDAPKYQRAMLDDFQKLLGIPIEDKSKQ